MQVSSTIINKLVCFSIETNFDSIQKIFFPSDKFISCGKKSVVSLIDEVIRSIMTLIIYSRHEFIINHHRWLLQFTNNISWMFIIMLTLPEQTLLCKFSAQCEIHSMGWNFWLNGNFSKLPADFCLQNFHLTDRLIQLKYLLFQLLGQVAKINRSLCVCSD